MESEVMRALNQSVMEALKICGERRDPPLVWTLEISKCLGILGLGFPSSELAEVLVSNLCFLHANTPCLWKFLEQSVSSRICSSLHVLSLLSSRVIPHRRSQPEAYRLYLELLRRYMFSVDRLETNSCREKIIKSVDATLQLSQTYQVQILEIGHAFVLSFFSVVVGLVDAILDDWGLQMTSGDRSSVAFGNGDHQNMEIDSMGDQNANKNEIREQMRRKNSFLAVEVLTKLTENQKSMALLRLVHLNMPEEFNGLLQRLHFLRAHKIMSSINPVSQLLVKLNANIQNALIFEYKLKHQQLISIVVGIGSSKSAACYNLEACQSACWVPFDIFMENVIDTKQLPNTSAIDILTESIRTLQVFNRSSWKETFLALWISALRLVQREREPLEGPIPHLEARLSVLLSIVPLSIVHVVEDLSNHEDASSRYIETDSGDDIGAMAQTSRKHGLVSSLQALGQFSALLCPPAYIVIAANNAAAKAANFISNSKDVLTVGARGDTSVKTGGNMRHLIVEACIARKLVDTSAYFWPGYVTASIVSQSDSSLIEKSPWSTFMEGAPLTGPLINMLITTPASSLAEVEKIYHIALNGSEDEKPAAAMILCGTSLSHGWNIQEHVVYFVVKLLSPPVPPLFSGPMSHVVNYMSMIHAVLSGCASIDVVHILSLHGFVPEVAASLLGLCEAFGSVSPTSSLNRNSGDEPSIYVVFSQAFLFLLRLWKFYKPPLEQCITGWGGAFGNDLTLEYLMLLRNSRIAPSNSDALDKSENSPTLSGSKLDTPIYIDFYPKLREWYCQNKSCIASTVSGLCSGNPAHEVANKILNMIYWKMSKDGMSNPLVSSNSSISDSSASTGDDSYQIPMLPAWEVLESIPFVLEAILTACSHGRLSSRDMTTGLRDLVNFLPASLGAIISYFSAEITRGIWKPVPMNGTDWPSPAVMLQTLRLDMDELLSGAGVHVQSGSGMGSIMLPLPMAALVSATITFKVDKSLEYIYAVSGPALENCSSSCPWPSTLVIASLWAQKARQWHDYIVLSCSRSLFRQSREAVKQLLKSCFTSFFGSLDSRTSLLSGQTGGMSGLLGSSICSPRDRPSVAPGFLYLRSCQLIHNVQYLGDVIMDLVIGISRELSLKWANSESGPLRSSRSSLDFITSRVKEVAILGASLLCVAGGLHLVQGLFKETLPTWLLKTRNENPGEARAMSSVMEGFALAYLLVFSGCLIWGVGPKAPYWARRSHIVGTHMDFLAGILDGNIALGCDGMTWKAYVSCFVGLVVSFAPMCVRDVKLGTLRKLAAGLRGWNEYDLALALLERGGVEAMGSFAELLHALY